MLANNRPTHLFLHDVNHANDVARKLFYVKDCGQSHAKEDPKNEHPSKGVQKGDQSKGEPVQRRSSPKETQSKKG